MEGQTAVCVYCNRPLEWTQRGWIHCNGGGVEWLQCDGCGWQGSGAGFVQCPKCGYFPLFDDHIALADRRAD